MLCLAHMLNSFACHSSIERPKRPCASRSARPTRTGSAGSPPALAFHLSFLSWSIVCPVPSFDDIGEEANMCIIRPKTKDHKVKDIVDSFFGDMKDAINRETTQDIDTDTKVNDMNSDSISASSDIKTMQSIDQDAQPKDSSDSIESIKSTESIESVESIQSIVPIESIEL